jgi:NAD(P)H-dependent flavin oxidoreductase YrpB (nitropropane dioxygenase family)
MSVIKTPITDLFGIKHPIILAGMNVAAGPELAAAVTNAGGLGVIGGVGYTPKVLRSQVRICRLSVSQCAYGKSQSQIQEIKIRLRDQKAPFGVDLLIPTVGGSARKTNVCIQPHIYELQTEVGFSTIIPKANSRS